MIFWHLNIRVRLDAFQRGIQERYKGSKSAPLSCWLLLYLQWEYFSTANRNSNSFLLVV